MFYKTLFSFVLYATAYASKTHYARTMCQSRDAQDCSFQINGAEENSCRIHNTSACKSFNFFHWSNAVYKYPERDLSSNFGMSLHPYPGNYTKEQLYLLPAINISMWSVDKEINGFVLTISGGLQQRNICRVFDFRQVSYEHRSNVSLFYDCIFLEYANSRRSYLFVLQALPINEVLQYEVLIPDGKESYANTLCLWKTLIMVFIKSLEDNIIKVKFISAPKEFGVIAYDVILYSITPEQEDSHKMIHTNVVETKEHDQMLFTSFDHVDAGYYYVKIAPVGIDKTCNGTTTSIIFIKTKLFDPSILGYVSILIIVTVAVIMAIQLYIRWNVKPGTYLSSPKILVVHSYDFKEHDAAVAAYIKVLEGKGCKVKSIYGSGHPSEWFWKHYEEADIIVIIISFGVYHKVEKFNNPTLPERHKWEDRLTPAISFINDEITSTKCKFDKKVAKVFFEYSGSNHIPQKMKFNRWGKTFALPKEMCQFMQYIHTREHKLCYPCMCPIVRQEEDSLSPEMRTFKDRIRTAKEVFEKEMNGNLLNACKREAIQACAFPGANSTQPEIIYLQPVTCDVDNQLNTDYNSIKLEMCEDSVIGTPVAEHLKGESDCVNDMILKDKQNSVAKQCSTKFLYHQKQGPYEKDMWDALFTEDTL